MIAAAIENEKASDAVENSKEPSEVKETEVAESVEETNWAESEPKPEQEQDDSSDCSQTIFSYDRLKAKSDNPVTGIDFKRREVCICGLILLLLPYSYQLSVFLISDYRGYFSGLPLR